MRTLLLLLPPLLLATSSCTTAPASPPAVDPALQSAYIAAVRDAANPEPDEICSTLTAITPANRSLVWRTIGGEPHVLVVSWISGSFYDGYVGKAYRSGSHEIWVTVVPELKRFCSGLEGSPSEVNMRLRQLIGLPPDQACDRFVELWVRPRDLYRPAPDREIDDTTAGLDLPADVPAAYRAWFNARRAACYCENCDSPPYPWTQLGYTYDWGNQVSPVGLSEFVVQPGATVVVESLEPTLEYCSGR